MLKKNMVFALVLSALSIAAFAQKKEKTVKTEASASKPKDAFNITITVKGYPERMFYLGYYFGDKQYLRDSAYTDKNGTMVFKGDKTLEGGIYLIATAQKSLLFDFVVTEQFFSLETDSVDVVKNMKVKGSAENDIFFTYTKYTTVMGRRAYELDEQIKAAKAANDTAAKRIAEAEYKKITGELVEYRKQLMKENPNALLSKIFKIMTDIEIPEAPRNSQGIIIDSNYQYQYY